MEYGGWLFLIAVGAILRWAVSDISRWHHMDCAYKSYEHVLVLCHLR